MKVENKIARARIQLLLNQPFLGTLALNLRLRDATGMLFNAGGCLQTCKTMGTDGRNLVYNPKFIETTADDVLMGVIAHEIMHIVYQHVLEWRSPATKEYPEIFTMAQEYVVNDAVVNMFTWKDGSGKEKRFTLSEGVFLDSAFFGMYTEQVYQELLKRLQPQKKQSLGQALEKGMVDQHGLGAPQGGNGEKGEKGKRAQGEGGGEDGAGGVGWSSKEEIEALARDIKLQVAQAANAARMRGSLPAGLERLINEVLEPQINWRAALAEFVCAIARNDYSWKTPNRRHLHRGIVLPALRSESIELAVCVDTSGSIGQDDLNTFFGELRGIMGAFPSYKLHLMACDAAVHSYQVVEPWDEMDIKELTKGGGDTSLVPAIKRLEEEDITPSAFIYLTDGYSDYGDEPPYPVLHVIKGGFKNIPWGRMVELD